MCREKIVRLFAGAMVLLGLGLGAGVNANWYWLTAFVGANLLQSSMTGFCLLSIILRRLHVTACAPEAL